MVAARDVHWQWYNHDLGMASHMKLLLSGYSCSLHCLENDSPAFWHCSSTVLAQKEGKWPGMRKSLLAVGAFETSRQDCKQVQSIREG